MKKTTRKLSLNAATVRILADDESKRAGGGVSRLGLTECFCAPTLGDDCQTGYTNNRCSVNYSNCGCNGTYYTCETWCG